MKTYLRAARLIDGNGALHKGRPVLEIEGAKITAVHPNGLEDAAMAGGVVQDFGDATILPGLIDTHVHLNLPGDGLSLEDGARESEATLVAISMGTAAQALGAGITSVRDVGCFGTTAFSVRRAIAKGWALGPTVMASGPPLTITGGHTWMMGGETDGVEALRAKVRLFIKQGADFIKVMGSGGGTIGSITWRPSYTQEEMDAIVFEAHRNERKVAVHCLCAASIDIAVKAGVDQIEHAGFITGPGKQEFDPAVAERLAASGIPVTSTLAVGATAVNAMQILPERTPAQEAFLANWLRMIDENLSHFRKLRAAGVTWVAGTDAGWRFTSFDSLTLELQMMQMGGFSALECLRAATGQAADIIGLQGRGRLAAGQAADVIVVGGNPAEDLAHLHDLRLILKDGRGHLPTPREQRNPQAMRLPEC